MCDGSRKDQEKCTDDPLLLEFKNVSYSWAFFYFLRLLNTIFTVQIIDSALVHWVKTLSVLISAEHFFVCNYFDLLFQRHSFLLCSLKLCCDIHNTLCVCVMSQCPVSCFMHNCFYETNWEKKHSHVYAFALSSNCILQ